LAIESCGIAEVQVWRPQFRNFFLVRNSATDSEDRNIAELRTKIAEKQTKIAEKQTKIADTYLWRIVVNIICFLYNCLLYLKYYIEQYTYVSNISLSTGGDT
jgi:hypothetical protein